MLYCDTDNIWKIYDATCHTIPSDLGPCGCGAQFSGNSCEGCPCNAPGAFASGTCMPACEAERNGGCGAIGCAGPINPVTKYLCCNDPNSSYGRLCCGQVQASPFDSHPPNCDWYDTLEICLGFCAMSSDFPCINVVCRFTCATMPDGSTAWIRTQDCADPFKTCCVCPIPGNTQGPCVSGSTQDIPCMFVGPGGVGY
jgi:hypothetical protein